MATKETAPHPNDTNADWLTPRQAVAILDAAFDQRPAISKAALLQCLRGKQVDAMSFTTHVAPDNRAEYATNNYKIPPEDWDKVDWNDTFFATGILVYRKREHGRSDYETIRHFNVKFNPEQVKRVAAPHQTMQAATTAQSLEDDTLASKGPPVSPAHLKAWYEVFQKVYGGSAEDTLDNALKSARGMFPGRFVSRDRVRDLAGGRSPGRKARKET
jgi:hypothetical protein